jgi:hypothetical protein
MTRSAKIVVGGDGARLGGFATRRGPPSAVEVVGDRASGVQIVDLSGMIEIQPEAERPLVKNGSERHHRDVRVGVTAAYAYLRKPSASRLLHQRLRTVDSGASQARIGTVLKRNRDRAIERPRLVGNTRGAQSKRGSYEQ